MCLYNKNVETHHMRLSSRASNKKTRHLSGFSIYPERSIIFVLPVQALCFRLFCR